MSDSKTIQLAAQMILAADGEKGAALKKFTGVAYSGGGIRQPWNTDPVYIDLASMKFRPQVPLMVDHWYNVDARVGECQAEVVDGRLEISGVIDASTERGRDLAERGAKIPWQLSVGAAPGKATYLKKGESTQCNGRQVEGPAIICQDYTLQEVSICAIGADQDTSLTIQASFSPDHSNPNPQQGTTEMLENTSTSAAPAVAASATGVTDTEKKAIQAAEKSRIADIIRLTARHPEIQAKAIEENWSGDQTARKVLEAIQAAAPAATVVVNHNEATPAENAEAIRAAVMKTAGVSEKNIIADCGEKAIEAADRQFRDGIGVQELLIRAAKQAGADPGYKVTMGNVGNVIKAAAASTIDVGGILGGVVDRRLYEGFLSIDQSWREITEVVSVKDFRAIETYQLISGGHFQKVTDGGELKHGSLTHSERTNQADLYGETLTLTLKDIINDDLNAFAKIPALLGQDAAIAFNEIFWKEFLDNEDFFSAGNGNLVSSCAFSLENLGNAVSAFRGIKDKGGHRIGGQPAIVLVPTGLEAKAANIYHSTEIRETASNKVFGTSNPYVGKFKPVCSPYLDDTDIANYSATSWYLLADPSRRAAMQAAFLNGQQAPTIERGVPAFNQLGVSFRAYQAFGCVKNVAQAGVRCNA